jgi:glycosyltransferase involved in cell wall biosynthesis
LQSVTSQSHANYEIVIADNASSDKTQEFCQSTKIRNLVYSRAEKPLSMTANWERAINLTSGEWVCFVGDDDALMPEVLELWDKLTEEYDVKAIQSIPVSYTWPTMQIPSQRDRLQFLNSQVKERVNWRGAIKHMIQYGGAPVPMVYHGLIHRDLINKAKETGKVFRSLGPDFYSGVQFAFLSEDFLRTHLPFCVAGVSSHSNGATFINNGNMYPDVVTTAIGQDFKSLGESEGLTLHPDLPNYTVGNPPIQSYDSVFHARDIYFPTEPDFRMSPDDIVKGYLKYLSPDLNIRETQLQRLQAYLLHRSPASNFYELKERFEAIAPSIDFIMHDGKVGVEGLWEVVDTSSFDVKDVYSASLLAYKLVNRH